MAWYCRQRQFREFYFSVILQILQFFFFFCFQIYDNELVKIPLLQRLTGRGQEKRNKLLFVLFSPTWLLVSIVFTIITDILNWVVWKFWHGAALQKFNVNGPLTECWTTIYCRYFYNVCATWSHNEFRGINKPINPVVCRNVRNPH